ncbi:hypothetical protein KDJ56_13595 [Brevibacillus composti]|uniref:Uncharacterized protein n=1 Tax=Brevibacillus composti TaxID=2796470 RepID=A0A7T5EI33_9BACL|nr:hypothetical protein [Brevibacillus composti]QQE72978.1 hypothetical protein JD108_13650 [Brevibacillus composti]QUO40056.1 hypothetical protein KDJ56_13595 [Brevibacillus composti]
MFGKKGKMALTAIVLYLLAWGLNIQFPHGLSLADQLVEGMGFPAWSRGNQGFHYAAIIQLGLMIVSYWMLVGVTKRPLITLVILLLAPAGLPKQQELVRWYQRTMANGIYMIEYKEDESRCIAKTKAEGVRTGSCMIMLQNHGDEAVQLELTVYGPKGRELPPVLSGYPLTAKGGEIEPFEVPVDPGGAGTAVYEEWYHPRITISHAGKERNL